MRYTQPQSGPLIVKPEFAGDLWLGSANSLPVGGGSPIIGTNPRGVGLNGDGASWFTAPSKVYASAPGFTFVFVAGGVASGSNASMICGKPTDISDFIWLNNGSGALRIRSNGLDADFAGIDTATPAGYVVYMDEYAGGSQTRYIYRNGVLAGTVSGVAGATFTQAAIGLGYNTTNYALNGFLDLLHIMPMASTPAEAAALSANPWQLFASPRRSLKASSSIPTLSAATMYGITSSGGYPQVTRA